jgi:Fe-S-cluster-containing hydrogenase component 2/CRP-like cAMP-binding protein
MAESFDPLEGPRIREDDEGLFSRDINGELVRVDAPTEGDYRRNINVQIDGQALVVPLAEPLTDAQGNIVRDIDGQTTPRYTTIYDAAVKLYVKNPGDEAKIPIPTLCHQQHMTPVGVCRMCVVQVYGQKRGARAAERKLLPACMHPVKEGMEVFTMNAPGGDGDRVRGAVKVLSEMLAAQHLKPAPAPAPAAELAPFNELQKIATRCGASISRFTAGVLRDAHAPADGPGAAVTGSAQQIARKIDATSPVFLVDHSACILCERCMRACDEVKRNNIIGRSGKGPTAKIGFDLNDPMGKSGCVQCGECMVSCPTTAITFKPVAQVKAETSVDGREQVLLAEDLINDALFSGVPPKFLLWQQGLAIKRFVKAGDVIYRQGEPGNTAFIIKSGTVEIKSWSPETMAKRGKAQGIIGSLLHRTNGDEKPVYTAQLTAEDIIFGEMACLSGTPRTADVVAVSDGEVWEIRRNVLDRLMRTPSQRGRFEGLYRSRAMNSIFTLELFQGLWKEEYAALTQFLKPKLSFVRAEPGQTIFTQGDPAENLYMIRLGHVRIDVERSGVEAAVLYQGPGTIIGETDLLTLAPEDRGRPAEEIDEHLDNRLRSTKGKLSDAVPAGRRSATATALDRLELVRLRREDFLMMVRDFATVRRRLIDLSLNRLRIAAGDGEQGQPAVREYVTQGLYQGQSLLVLDLNKCTRCDECVRACIDQHGTVSHGLPFTRLRRDGMQFKNWLVATACRSCKDAYCMIGCPVDAIHRGKHQQIVIEDHCIGCGLCATNCPYGNITLIPDQNRIIETADPDNPGQTRKVAQLKAATCDLCDAEGKMDKPVPRCVYACPHDAAHRMTGEELLAKVTATAAAPSAMSASDAVPKSV